MKIVALTPELSVSEQIAVADIAEIAAAGFRVLVNNRPDGEVPGQPSSAAIAAAARDAGLEYHYLPVTADTFPGDAVADIGALFDGSKGATLAFCRSGTRCTNLWVATRQGDQERSTAESIAAALGYDLSMARKTQ